MDFEDPGAPTADKIISIAEAPLTSKKNQGTVPKRIHKAEREKLKREHFNDLFLELADTLELNEQNNGKASILCETTRVVKDLLAQIECLKRENTALLSESQYVVVEKNELQEETSALQTQIGDLKQILRERTLQSNLDLNEAPAESQEPQLTSYTPEGSVKFPVAETSPQQAPFLNPVYLIPVCSNREEVPATKHISTVSKPHPRYPTPSDSWPFQILEKQRELGKELDYRGREQVFGNV